MNRDFKDCRFELSFPAIEKVWKGLRVSFSVVPKKGNNGLLKIKESSISNQDGDICEKAGSSDIMQPIIDLSIYKQSEQIMFKGVLLSVRKPIIFRCVFEDVEAKKRITVIYQMHGISKSVLLKIQVANIDIMSHATVNLQTDKTIDNRKMLKEKKWRFIPNQNSTIVGINDAGIETFTANMYRSLIRESIQNSLDAHIEEVEDPVVIEFNLFHTERSNVPDVDGLYRAIQKCKSSNQDEVDAYDFFENAEKLLSQKIVPVMRISDYNTIGLEGSDTCEKGSAWSRLVKESGSSNKGKSSGGSFGIGKSSAFACSDLRTVFYSSIDKKNGLKSNFGVARLVSFEDESMGWTTGIGYYSEDDNFIAIPELAQIDDSYKRETSGTDIFIVGMNVVPQMNQIFIEAVLMDFLVSLIRGNLIVKIQGETIDKSTLPKYIASLNRYDSQEICDLINYYYILTALNPEIIKIPLQVSEYGAEFGFENNDAVLYLKEGDKDYNRKIMVTRKAGMRITEINRISGSIQFTGVLIMDGERMNETFKAMEVPSHDAWEPGRCRGKVTYYKKVLSGLKKYLKKMVLDSLSKNDDKTIDAFGASDFLPDLKVEQNGQKMDERGISFNTIKIFGDKVVAPSTEKVNPDEKGDGGDSGGSGPGDGKGPKPGPGPHPGPEKGPFDGGTGEDESKSGDGMGPNKKMKQITVKKRLMCKDPSKGRYLLSFLVPSNSRNGRLEFSLAGEQNDYKLPIIKADNLEDKVSYSIESINNNSISLKNLKKGEHLRIEVQVDFDSTCMMEVEYYANKK